MTPRTAKKPFCFSCGSTQYLRHIGDCQDWKIPVIWPAPLDDLELDLEDQLVGKPNVPRPSPRCPRRAARPSADQGLLFTLSTEGAAP